MKDPDFDGMDLRDYFAAKAMQGYMSRKLIDGFDEDVVAEMSYKVADAMMKAREPEDDSHEVMAAAIMKKKENKDVD
jgi:hypothetical protein